ncbi:MAG: hypothetical protein U1E25_04600 [Methylocystis sp.]
MKQLTEPYAALPASMLTALGIDREAFGALSRTRHWADTLTGSTARDHAALLGTARNIASSSGTNLAADSFAKATAGFTAKCRARGWGTRQPLCRARCHEHQDVAVAGAIDVLGPGAGGSQAAYAALLGGYSSVDMLDRAYWRDPRERARYYRDQDVDDGLIDADNAATVAVLIDSGVVEDNLTARAR